LWRSLFFTLELYLTRVSVVLLNHGTDFFFFFFPPVLLQVIALVLVVVLLLLLLLLLHTALAQYIQGRSCHSDSDTRPTDSNHDMHWMLSGITVFTGGILAFGK
jgi:hypothetical protein